MLVVNLSYRGEPGKLRPYWGQEIYVVTQKRVDMPVYEVRPENGGGRSRILTRNLLLPCSNLPLRLRSVQAKVHRRALEKLANGSLPLEE